MPLPNSKKRLKSRAAARSRLARWVAPGGSARPVDALLRKLQNHEIELERQNEALRQAQIALEDSRDRYLDLYEHAPVGYLSLTYDGLIERVNLNGARLLGRERQDLLRQRFLHFVVVADQDSWQRVFASIKDGNAHASLELALARDDATVFQAQLDCVALNLAGGPGVSVVLNDISARRQAERALLDSHQTLYSILATTRDGYWHVDAHGGLLDVNAVYCQLSGYARIDLLGVPIGMLETPESAVATAEHLRRISATGSGQFESTQRRKDGSVWYAEVSVTYREAEGGEYFFFLRDISERKRADEVLREQKEFFHLIAENIGDFIAVLDVDGKRLYNSPSYLQFFGAERDLRGTDSFSEVHPEDRQRVRQAFLDTVRSGVGSRLAYRFLKADGSVSEMESHGNVIRDKDGKVARVVVVSHDVTERNRAERAIKESEAFKNTVLNSLAAEIAVIDRDGVIQAVNERWRRFSLDNGASAGQALPRTDIGVNYLAVCADDPAAGAAYAGIRAVLDGRSATFSLEYPCHSARQQHWFSMIVTPLGRDSQHGVAITHTDITALKQAEQYEQFRSRILELLADGKPLPVILEALARGVEQIAPTMLCSIQRLDSEGQRLGQGVAPSLPASFNDAIDGVPVGVGYGSCSMAAYTGERVIVEDIGQHPFWVRLRAPAALAGLGACWSQPIRAATGQVLGTFAIYLREPCTPSAYDLTLIEQTARLASIAIERNLAAEKLKESAAHYRLLTEDVSDVVWKQDREQRFTYISPADERLRGYRADEVIGRHYYDFLNSDGIAVASEKDRQRRELEQRGVLTGTTSIEVQQRCKDGRSIWVEISSTPERDDSGRVCAFHGISRDITQRKQIEAQINRVQNLLKETERIGRVGGWELQLDSEKQVWTEEIYNIHEVDLDFVPTLDNGIAFYTPESRPVIEQAVRRAIERDEPFDLELEIVTARGKLRSVHVIGKPDREQRRVSGFFQDITERKYMEEQMRQLAFYDPLTKLPNRRLFKDRLNLTMAASARSGLYAAVMFIDLDNFKPLNDTHGHEVGDLLLIEVAERMRACVREMDTVARVGGDEFIVMISELKLDKAESTAQANVIAEKIRVSLEQPYRLVVNRERQTTVEHHCTASIGVVLFNNHEVSQDDIIGRADRAMYEAKEAGRNWIQFDSALP